MAPVSPKFYRRFCIYGRSPKNLIASVALRSPAPTEQFGAGPCTVVLDEVWTHRAHRGQGLCRELMHLALESASRYGWVVYCRPVAHDGGPGPDQLGLEAFYATFGFEPMPWRAPWLVRQHHGDRTAA